MITPDKNMKRKRLSGWRTRGVARRGAAVVEAAMCVPVAMILLFGTVELTRGIHLRQSMSVAAYEGGRAVTMPGASSDSVRSSVDQVMADRGVTEYTVAISPADVATTGRGELVTVSVAVPARSNAIVPLEYFTGRTANLNCSVTVMKEF